MNFTDTLKQWFGVQTPPPPQVAQLRYEIEQGRNAKYAEDYPNALAAFERALAIGNRSDIAYTLIRLHIADVYILQGRFEDAHALLHETKDRANANHQPAHLAYILNTDGVLQQAQGDWVSARATYEEALKIAREAKAQGPEGRAMGHLAETYLQEQNASYAIHLLRDALKHLNASGDIELSSYFVGLLGEALLASGQSGEAEEMLIRALRLADHMKYRRYQRRWRVALGNYAARNKRPNEALEHYKRAIPLYSQQDQDYLLTVCAAAENALLFDQVFMAQEYVDLAKRALTTLATRDAFLQARVANADGAVLLAIGDLDTARAQLEQATANYSHADASPLLQSQVRRLLAQTQTHEQAIDTLQTAYMLAQKNSETPLEVAHVQRDLGLRYVALEQHTQALQVWAPAITLYDQHKQYSDLAKLHCDVAAARRALGQIARAMKEFEQALMLLNYIKDSQTRGAILAVVAMAYAEYGDGESAEGFFHDAIQMALQAGDRLATSKREGNYGWFLMTNGRTAKALDKLNHALSLSRQLSATLLSAVQSDNLGQTHTQQGSYESAVHFHRQALELIASLPETPEHQTWRATFQANTALTLIHLIQYDEAQQLAAAAHAFAQAHQHSDILARALFVQAELAAKQDQHEAATPLFEEAFIHARKRESRYLCALILSAHSQHQAQLGDKEQAQRLWTDAQKYYQLLRHPLVKTTPSWLQAVLITPE
jgi:tetratricopeptide (TPR) repeat protein